MAMTDTAINRRHFPMSQQFLEVLEESCAGECLHCKGRVILRWPAEGRRVGVDAHEYRQCNSERLPEILAAMQHGHSVPVKPRQQEMAL